MFNSLGRKARADKDRNQASEREIEALSRTYIMMRLAMDGTILDANEQFFKFTGFDKEETIGSPHSIFVRDKDLNEPEIVELWKVMDQGEDLVRIMPRLNRQGEEIWLDLTYSPIAGSDGKTEFVMLIAREITGMHLRRRDNRSQVDALKRSLAVIEFDLDGNILEANDLFEGATGYTVDQIKGKHHSMFMAPGEADKPEYRQFWERLKNGSSESGQVRRVNAKGEDLWLQATYETLIDPEGRPFKVIKYAFDITEAKNLEADANSQIQAIQRVQAVIQFKPDGTILEANDVFYGAMGYTAAEIVGKHHSMFLSPKEATSAAYQTFWSDLAAGKEVSGTFQRVAKGNKPVYLQASYNPIHDAAGKVVKVVKYAVDTTALQRTVDTLGEGLERLSKGDLAVRLHEELGDLDMIRQRFNEALSQLMTVISQVNDRTSQVGTEAGAIMSATDDLARRTEMQAATLEQSAAALEEMSESVRGSASTAESARGSASEAKNQAEESARIVGEAVSAMNELADSSEKISKITNVIDEIAFQTNLLALNAGVEAARAGEEGRGFAVVASEVRALAQRSSDAAQEIADLISASVRQVTRGVDLVRRVGDAITEVDTMVGQITNSIAEIASSAQEQASGISEMNTSINQLDRATQQNAAMSEETNAAIKTLNSSIEETQSQLGYFNSDGGDTDWRSEDQDSDRDVA